MIIEKYAAKISELLKNLDTSNFPQNFSADEMILGTGNRFLYEIEKDCMDNGILDEAKLIADLNKLYECLSQELNQNIINELRITAYYAQIIRDKLGLALFVTCAFRPVGWEKHRGRSGESFHTKGFAVDFFCTQLNRAFEIVTVLFALGGRKQYSNFIHFDRDRRFRTW